MRVIFILALWSVSQIGISQVVKATSPTFEKRLNFLLSNKTVEQKFVAELEVEDLKNYVVLDAREWEEYETSHLEGARYIGYDNPVYSVLSDVDKSQPILLYCSIGYRSQRIGKQLKKKGFENVYNLYGSIFEWANQGKPIIDSKGQETKAVHTYNKKWSKWMINPDYEKVW